MSHFRSIYPNLYDARWKIVRGTNIVPGSRFQAGRNSIFCKCSICTSWWSSKQPSIYNPEVKSPDIRSEVNNRSIIVFLVKPGKNCYGVSCVQASVVGYLDVTAKATRKLVRALWMSKGAWCKVYAVWFSRLVFVRTDVVRQMLSIEWIKGRRNWKIVCQ